MVVRLEAFEESEALSMSQLLVQSAVLCIEQAYDSYAEGHGNAK